MSDELVVESLPGYQPTLGAALWTLEDTRARTLEALDGLPDAHLDLVPPGHENSIGTLLYHLAAIELDWLYVEILGSEFPGWAHELFPEDVRTQHGRLTPMGTARLGQHLERLAVVRRDLLKSMKTLSDTDFVTPSLVDGRMVSPQWVIHHLSQHEAEHRGHIQTLRSTVAADA